MNVADVVTRNNVCVLGEGEKTLMLAHGFGCNQGMWQQLVERFASDYKIVLFDYMGSGKSDIAQFNSEKYSKLEGYADDILAICTALKLKNVHLVGHSVSSIIGILAAKTKPEIFSSLVMVCPSPCFLNLPDEGYFGGFELDDLHELLDLMESNYIGWANYLSPVITSQSTDEPVTSDFVNSFCSTDPICAKVFAKATFLSDYRAELADTSLPVLILQSENDVLASVEVGKYISEHVHNSSLVVLPCKGHAVHMTDTGLTTDAMKAFYATRI